ncbi:nitroreductase family protein [Spiroplasma chrysopicola]|uniref:Oxygen-insensitive NAD(P)H nitroreductase n=1 Tax=Spiroplasma chrysopicola DF-1 TaxID=1276227 RepID=R4UH12_9MOLU|nr:nitroreductase family protein [Spiroplasma chrysopicola]AGM24616.1 oxygen-insensitive NAD(P)H nitroreductase [Spiroplasma chrysopicola DF-1]
MSVQKAINWRKTVKKYNENKKISHNDLNLIIEAGRLAPSSMGLEVAKLIVIRNKITKAQVADQVMQGNIAKVKEADALVFLVGVNPDYLLTDEFLSTRLSRAEGISAEKLQEYINRYRNYFEKSAVDLKSYVAQQIHITASFMALQAADLKVGSTIMGGFNAPESDKILAELGYLDLTKYHSILTMAFGYYDEKTEGSTLPRLRISTDDFVNIIE